MANVGRLPGDAHLDVPENEEVTAHDSLHAGRSGRIKVSSRFSHGQLSTLELEYKGARLEEREVEEHREKCLAQKQALGTGAVESSIIAAVTAALNVPLVTRNGNLLELGVDSLVGARIVGRLRTELSLDIPLLALFENPVIADLAEEIVALAEDSC
jgi:acyl carrier protein